MERDKIEIMFRMFMFVIGFAIYLLWENIGFILGLSILWTIEPFKLTKNKKKGEKNGLNKTNT